MEALDSFESEQLSNPQEEKTHPFQDALRELINKHSMENESDTPDFILARYMFACLSNYQNTVKSRDTWFGVDMWAIDKIAK